MIVIGLQYFTKEGRPCSADSHACVVDPGRVVLALYQAVSRLLCLTRIFGQGTDWYGVGPPKAASSMARFPGTRPREAIVTRLR